MVRIGLKYQNPNSEYRKFEELAKIHTNFIYKELILRDPDSPPPIANFFCDRGFIEEIKKRKYEKIKCAGINLIVVSFGDEEKHKKIFAFYDLKYKIDEAALINNLFKKEDVIEIQVRAVQDLEEVLDLY